jgi:hypothetical protein
LLFIAFAGKLGDANSMFQRALAMQQTTLGDNHPQTLATQVALASLLKQVGKLDHASISLRRSLGALAEVFGTGSCQPSIASAMCLLAG